MVSVVVHTNPHLDNQRICGAALVEGFRACGVDARESYDRSDGGDFRVIQGPWWAYRDFLGVPGTLFLNRCFYGCPDTVLSIGWLNADGSRDFRNQGKTKPKGELPELQPRKEYRGSAVVFADYNHDGIEQLIQDVRSRHERVYFRPHPAQPRGASALPITGDLSACWQLCDVAVGHSSTALVEAKINGLRVETTDRNHVVKSDDDRQTWLTRLSWAQWSLDEIRSGAFWEHLQ